VLFIAWLAAGGILHALRAPAPTPDLPRATSLGLGAWPRVGFVEAATILAAIDLLFVAFVLVQFAYLFGGRDTLDLAGLTYSEYARRGFFELLAVAAVALPLVASLDALADHSTRSEQRAFRLLAATLVLCTLVVLASAVQRLLLYEDAYGYTHLRLYSHAFMLWLAAMCCVVLVSLVIRRRGLLPFGTLVWLVALIAGLALVAPDRFIAEQNLRRYAAGRPLDTVHLSGLSADAVPALLQAFDLATERDDARVRTTLAHGLYRQLRTLDLAAADSWATWNLARAEAHAALDARRADFAAPPPRDQS
jgi:hypothetical protein